MFRTTPVVPLPPPRPGGAAEPVTLLAPGQPPPPVWTALRERRIEDTRFEVLDQGMRRPCAGCRQRWVTHHPQLTLEPWAARRCS